MAKKIRFPLKMKNGAEVRTLDELKENFDLESVLGYFTDGKLATWLSDRYYDEKAEAVSALSKDLPDLNAKLCDILEVEYQGGDDVTDLEYIQRRNEKYRLLSTLTDDRELIDNIDIVAFNDKDIIDIFFKEKNNDVIYLYGEEFFIEHLLFENVCFTGIGSEKPCISLFSSSHNPLEECAKKRITFRNVRYAPLVQEAALSLYRNKKYDLSFPVFLEGAQSGDLNYQFLLVSMYYNGHGVEKNNSEAFRWCNKAAEQGMKEAQEIIGSMYFNGSGVDKDLFQATEWFRKSAEQGYAKAQCNLGFMYNNGYAVEKDYTKAVEWYRKAAEQGYADAQNQLGKKYHRGEGVAQNFAEAFMWYSKAAEQGDADAQNNLAFMYFNGYGIEQNKTKAVEWLRKAAEQGNEAAISNLKNLGVPL